MNVGVTGHQYRSTIDWSWVSHAVRVELSKLTGVTQLFSSLATGSDQIAASVALDLNIPVTAVLPLEGYDKFFSGHDLVNYRRLLGRCQTVQLHWKGSPERAFFEAGKFVVDNSDTLLAVWDGENAEGLGGTGDVVEYAKPRSKMIVHLNPITQAISIL
jgi:hypothetical protein